jgi:hypothetical protein
MPTAVDFDYPGAVGASVFQYECSSCKSTVLVRAVRPKGLRPASPTAKIERHAQLQGRVIKASPLLKQLMLEEREHAEKPVEQVDAEAQAT